MHNQHIITAEQHRNYYTKQILTGKIIQYIILANDFAIGTVFFKFLNKEEVELGIFIGEKEFKGKGFGRESFYKLLQEIR